MKIFLDLDGTILDSKERLYVLFQQLVPASQLSFDNYWDLKRNKINHQTILKKNFNYSDLEYKVFEEIWLKNIEKPELLKLDKPVEKVQEFLKEASKKNDLFILTERQSKENMLNQLEELNLIVFFKDFLVTEKKTTKEKLIIDSLKINKQDIIIGDTGHDIIVGKNLGVKTIAITSGFVSMENLLIYEPDYIYNKLIDIILK